MSSVRKQDSTQPPGTRCCLATSSSWLRPPSLSMSRLRGDVTTASEKYALPKLAAIPCAVPCPSVGNRRTARLLPPSNAKCLPRAGMDRRFGKHSLHELHLETV